MNLETIKNKKGISLLELVVALGLFVIVILAVTGIFQSLIRTQSNALTSQLLQDNLRFAFEVMSREIRTAEPSAAGECGIIQDNMVYYTPDNKSLYFKNSTGDCTVYSLTDDNGTQRLKIERGGIWAYGTSQKINISDLRFVITDTELNPKVTFSIKVEPEVQSSSSYDLNLQTTISYRSYEGALDGIGSFVLYFEPQGGTVSPEIKQVQYGKAVGELPVPKRTGYDFWGWNIQSDGLGDYYEESTIYENKNNTIVYAIWTETPNTQVVLCQGLPNNAMWNTAEEITQTLIAGIWEPTNIGEYNWESSTEHCYFICENQNYTWTGIECAPDIVITSCTPKPEDSEWNIVSTIRQTWTGIDWEPSEISVYDEEPSDTECRFKCRQYYVWDRLYELCYSECALFDYFVFDDAIFCAGDVDTRIYSCPAKPAKTDWNLVSYYPQSCHKYENETCVQWVPHDSQTHYNETATNDACHFVCSQNYIWDEDIEECVLPPGSPDCGYFDEDNYDENSFCL